MFSGLLVVLQEEDEDGREKKFFHGETKDREAVLGEAANNGVNKKLYLKGSYV